MNVFMVAFVSMSATTVENILHFVYCSAPNANRFVLVLISAVLSCRQRFAVLRLR